MNQAEWAKVSTITEGKDYVPHAQAFGLVTAFDIINYACPIIGFHGVKTKTYGLAHEMPTNHWSRCIEYPWALVKAELTHDASVIDVGGGNNPFQFALAFLCGKVMNVDTDMEKLTLADRLAVRHLFPNLTLLHQDVLTLPAYGDGIDPPGEAEPTNYQTFAGFDRVFCLSVFEHMPDPVRAVKHLYNMVKPGGKLIVSFDVSDSPCKDFPITFIGAQRILAEFGLEMPSMEGALSQAFRIDDKLVHLWVMMMAIDKPIEPVVHEHELGGEG